MRIVFVGETWQGSGARSLLEELGRLPGVVIAEVGEDHFLPKHRSLALRILSRLLKPWHIADLANVICRKLDAFRPDVLIVYKGWGVRASLIKKAKAAGIRTVNIFPDYSPHAYGRGLWKAIGEYDLVISTKSFHPGLWTPLYGYNNRCVFVPHGYSPTIHLWQDPPTTHNVDLALCATWRPEYHRLMLSVASELGGENLSVAIAGQGWLDHRSDFPDSWLLPGPITGRGYGEFLRSAKIVVAPVHRDVIIRGQKQPGDEDTARSYQLASAYCFFLHQRTDFITSVYDENTEVPLWGNAKELAGLVMRWLPDEEGRRRMAAAAHTRAVPAYSTAQRAMSVLHHVTQLVNEKNNISDAA